MIGDFIFIIFLGLIIVYLILFLAKKSSDISHYEDKAIGVTDNARKQRDDFNDKDMTPCWQWEDNDLIRLRNSIMQLAYSLHEINEIMSCPFHRQLEEEMMYNDIALYIAGYRPSIHKCEEIAERYLEWCKRVLEPTIDEIIIETTDVGGDGDDGVGIGNGGDLSYSGSSVAGGKHRGFDLGGKDREQKFRDAAAALRERADKMPSEP